MGPAVSLSGAYDFSKSKKACKISGFLFSLTREVGSKKVSFLLVCNVSQGVPAHGLLPKFTAYGRFWILWGVHKPFSIGHMIIVNLLLG